MDKVTILLVDDELSHIELVRPHLLSEGFHLVASSASEALHEMEYTQPDLVVVALPEHGSQDMCHQLRARGDVPIIVVAGQTGEMDAVRALELGADDYLAQPLNPRELVARVKAVLRRAYPRWTASGVISFGNLRVDTRGRTVHIGDREVQLRPKEFDLLVLLARNPGLAFDRDDLFHAVWGWDYLGESRTIDVHITRLRQKLVGSAVAIQAVWGVGYKFTPADARKTCAADPIQLPRAEVRAS